MRISDWSSDVCSSDLIGLGAGEILDDAQAVFEKRRALGGQRQAARGARDQPHAEACFERVDAAADHCRRQIERTRGGGQAAALRNLPESLYFPYRIHQACT